MFDNIMMCFTQMYHIHVLLLIVIFIGKVANDDNLNLQI